MSKVSWVTRDGRRIAVDDNTAALLDCLEGQHEALLERLGELAKGQSAAAPTLDSPELRERLADYAHEAWSGWMYYLFDKSTRNADGSVTIPTSLVERWHRQMKVKYAVLPPSEQESDRKEADRMLAIVREHLG